MCNNQPSICGFSIELDDQACVNCVNDRAKYWCAVDQRCHRHGDSNSPCWNNAAVRKYEKSHGITTSSKDQPCVTQYNDYDDVDGKEKGGPKSCSKPGKMNPTKMIEDPSRVFYTVSFYTFSESNCGKHCRQNM